MAEDLYFDVETNGLLPDLHSMWCIAITDLNTEEEFYYGPAVHPSHPLATPLLCEPTGTVADGVRRLSAPSCGLSVAHNGINYDYLALEKLYPEEYVRPPRAWDSIVVAKVVWPGDFIADRDWALIKAGKMNPGMAKRHNLKAWGIRLGEHKDEYDGDRDKYPEPSDRPAKSGDERYDKRWEEWNPWLASYMMQDNRPGVKLWKLARRRMGWDEPDKAPVVWPEQCIEVEHDVAAIVIDQENFGVRFNRAKAQDFERELLNERSRLEAELYKVFGPWWAHSATATVARSTRSSMQGYADVSEPRVSEKTGKELKPLIGPPLEHTTTGSTYTPVTWTDFKPSSRDHLGQRLQAVYGWRPKKFGATHKPAVDETVLEEIPEAVLPEAVRRTILDTFVVAKTLGVLRSWLKLSEADGRIHGRLDPAGAVTGRGTHSSPNMSACPSVRKEKVKGDDGTITEVPIKGLRGRYGCECRDLFEADEGWELTGIDASSLELIMLGHYLFPHDGGKFSERVCDPTRDAHQEHALLADMTRGDAKTTIYLYVFGGSAYKLSLDIGIDPEEVPGFLTYRGLNALMKSVEKRFGPEFVANMDDTQRAKIAKARTIILKFEAGIEGIKDLKKGISEAAERKWLKGLDGRWLFSKSPHSALNLALQGGGAQAIKLWMVLLHRRLVELGYRKGRDFKQVLWSHDEFQITHRPGLGPIIKEEGNRLIAVAGQMLGLRGTLRAEAKTGRTWFDTH